MMMLGISAIVAGALFYIARPARAEKIQWCPKGQEAYLVGSGYDVNHNPVEAIMCEKVGSR
jgi:hypothetical protein